MGVLQKEKKNLLTSRLRHVVLPPDVKKSHTFGQGHSEAIIKWEKTKAASYIFLSTDKSKITVQTIIYFSPS